MADLKDALPKTWSSPTMSPHCADETKYGVADAVVKHFEALAEERRQGRGPEDPRSRHRQRRARHRRGRQLGPGAGLIEQAELVVVVESPVSEQRMRDMFEAMDSVLRTHPEVGAYNQKI
jgi:phosphomannomutase/phosphoglucomutase